MLSLFTVPACHLFGQVIAAAPFDGSVGEKNGVTWTAADGVGWTVAAAWLATYGLAWWS